MNVTCRRPFSELGDQQLLDQISRRRRRCPRPCPCVAPSESLHTASLAPESFRDDPFAELSPGPSSAAPLLHPQRQRELIEQATGMSTRQVAGLLAAAAPAAPARRGGGDTPAPRRDTAATERQNPIAMLANAAPPSQSAPAALADDARAGGAPSAAPAATAASQSAPAALSDGARAGGVPSGAPATAAPQFAGGASADSTDADAGAGVPVSPVATSAPKPACAVFLDGGPSGAAAGAAGHTTRDSVHGAHQSPPRRHIPAAVRRHVWLRDGGRCCYRDPLTGRRCTSSHLLPIDHLLPVAQGGGPEPSNLVLRCFAHHRMRHGHGPATPPEPPM